jgi:predicted Zn-dependent protease
VGAHFTWITWQGSVFRLTGMALGGSSKLEGVFRSVARSFRPITPQERASISERRLRIATARGGESIGELSRRTGNEWDIQRTAVMNGIFATARLESGQLMKIAVSEGAGPAR